MDIVSLTYLNLLLVLLFAAGILHNKIRLRKRWISALQIDRDRLPLGQLVRDYFKVTDPEEAERTTKVLRALSLRVLGVDAGLLRPHDDLFGNLQSLIIPPETDDPPAEIERRLEQATGYRIPISDHCHTLRQIVQLVQKDPYVWRSISF